MSKFQFVLDKAGVGQLLKSKETESMLKSLADDAVSRLGEGHSSDSYIGRTRANASYSADSIRAKRRNLRDNTLLKALK